jgi:hypothetical protein
MATTVRSKAKDSKDSLFKKALTAANYDLRGLTHLILQTVAFLAAILSLEKFFGVGRPLSIAFASIPFIVFGLLYFVPLWIEARAASRRKQLGIDGKLEEPDYFRLIPYTDRDQKTFRREDKVEKRITNWIVRSQRSILYLYGQSGAGKSSLLEAAVFPTLKQQDPPWLIIPFRLGVDPVASMKSALLKPDVIWRDGSRLKSESLAILLERATQYARTNKRRILIAIDQFEEFFILADYESRIAMLAILREVASYDGARLTVLLSLRAEYLSDLSSLDLPPPTIGENCEEVRPFSQAAAQQFLVDSGLVLDDVLVSKVLREAAEIEELPDRIRAIVINMLGMVLSSFKGELPKGVDPQHFLQGYVRRAISERDVRALAPRLLKPMITSIGTKRPLTLENLAEATSVSPAEARGCLIKLGQQGLVRCFPSDSIKKEQWEISHDFVARLLQPQVQTWTLSVGDQLKFWLAPLGLGAWLVLIGLLAAFTPFIKKSIATEKLASVGITPSTSGYNYTVGDTSTIEQRDFVAALPYFDWLNRRVSVNIPANTYFRHGEDFGSFRDWPLLVNLTGISVEGKWGIFYDMPSFPSLEWIEVTGGSPSFHHMPQLPALKKLTIQASEIRDFEEMPAQPELNSLNISGTIQSFSAMPVMPKLETLDISGAIQSFSAMPVMPKLKSLTIKGSVSSLAGFPVLPKLESLELLGGSDSEVAGRPPVPDRPSIDPFPSVPQPLASPRQSASPSPSSLADIPVLPSLRSLRISIPIASLTGMSAQPYLEILAIEGRLSSSNGLPPLPNLRKISLNSNDTSWLPALPQITAINVICSNGPDLSLENWPLMPSARSLEIDCRLKDPKSLDRVPNIQALGLLANDNLVGFPVLLQLEKLVVAGKIERLQGLPRLPKLGGLILRAAPNILDLSEVSLQPNLEELILPNRPVSQFTLPTKTPLKYLTARITDQSDIDAITRFAPSVQEGVFVVDNPVLDWTKLTFLKKLDLETISNDLRELTKLRGLEEFVIDDGRAYEPKQVDMKSLAAIAEHAQVKITANSNVCRETPKKIDCQGNEKP